MSSNLKIFEIVNGTIAQTDEIRSQNLALSHMFWRHDRLVGPWDNHLGYTNEKNKTLAQFAQPHRSVGFAAREHLLADRIAAQFSKLVALKNGFCSNIENTAMLDLVDGAVEHFAGLMLNPKTLFCWHTHQQKNRFDVATRYELAKWIHSYAERHHGGIATPDWFQEFENLRAELDHVSAEHKRARAAEIRRPDNPGLRTSTLDAETRFREAENAFYTACLEIDLLFEDTHEDNSHWQHKPQTSPKEPTPTAQPLDLLDSTDENKI